MQEDHDRCDSEWGDTVFPPSDSGEQIRRWVPLEGKCASGLYESRLARLYGLASNFAEARKVANRGLSLKTAYDRELLSAIAFVDMTESKLDESLHGYEELIRRYPDFVDGYAGAGAVLVVMGRPARAISYLDDAEKRGKRSDVYRNKAIAYVQLEKYDDAVKAFKDGYAANKYMAGDKDSMHAAAVAYAHLGKFQIAVGVLRMLFHDSPGAASVVSNK